MQLQDTRGAASKPLPHSQMIDLTTTGRRTGQPRRIEIVLHNFDGRLYISGSPHPTRTRAWLLNLVSDPRLILHFQGTAGTDLPGTARIITDEIERRAIAERLVRVWRSQDVEAMTRYSPMIEVKLADRD